MSRLLLALLVVPLLSQAGDIVRISTPDGEIFLELYGERAPVTVENFHRYIEAEAFDGGSFYRVVRDGNQPDSKVKINVIQGGPKEGFEDFAEIPLERTRDTGIKHEAGTISMARLGPDSATGHFFICVTDEPELDFGGARNPDGQGFAAFGKVVHGMDIVRGIHQMPAVEQTLQSPVQIWLHESRPVRVIAAQLIDRMDEWYESPEVFGKLVSRSTDELEGREYPLGGSPPHALRLVYEHGELVRYVQKEPGMAWGAVIRTPAVELFRGVKVGMTKERARRVLGPTAYEEGKYLSISKKFKDDLMWMIHYGGGSSPLVLDIEDGKVVEIRFRRFID